MAWAVIDSLNAPASNVFDFPSLSLGSYKAVRVWCSGITVTTDATEIELQYYVGSLVTTGYRYAGYAVSTSAATDFSADDDHTAIRMTAAGANFDVGNASTESLAPSITVDAPASSALYKKAIIDAFNVGPAGNCIGYRVVGLMLNAGAITGLKISGTSNLTAGKVRVLGLA
jgi:hypothetical protein